MNLKGYGKGRLRKLGRMDLKITKIKEEFCSTLMIVLGSVYIMMVSSITHFVSVC